MTFSKTNEAIEGDWLNDKPILGNLFLSYFVK